MTFSNDYSARSSKVAELAGTDFADYVTWFGVILPSACVGEVGRLEHAGRTCYRTTQECAKHSKIARSEINSNVPPLIHHADRVHHSTAGEDAQIMDSSRSYETDNGS